MKRLLLLLVLCGCGAPPAEPEFVKVCTIPSSMWTLMPNPMGAGMGGMSIGGGMSLVLVHGCLKYEQLPNPKYKKEAK